MATLAFPLALAACGGGGTSSTHGMCGVSPPATTTQAAQTPSTTTGTTASRAVTTRTTPTQTAPTSTRATITVGGQVESVAPGTRAACIHRWAPQFPAGQARHAVLSQCKNLPR